MGKDRLTSDEVIEAWLTQHDEQYGKYPPEVVRNSLLVTDTMLQLLAKGKPVSTKQAAAKLDVSVEEIEGAFKTLRKGGYEFDEAGRLIGAALTLSPTSHEFWLNGKTFYTWCALDALFLPGLLNQTAIVMCHLQQMKCRIALPTWRNSSMRIQICHPYYGLA